MRYAFRKLSLTFQYLLNPAMALNFSIKIYTLKVKLHNQCKYIKKVIKHFRLVS